MRRSPFSPSFENKARPDAASSTLRNQAAQNPVPFAALLMTVSLNQPPWFLPGWFHVDHLTLSTGDLFSGQSRTADSFQVQVQKTASAKQICLQTVNDSSTSLTTNWVDLTSGWHALEIQSVW